MFILILALTFWTPHAPCPKVSIRERDQKAVLHTWSHGGSASTSKWIPCQVGMWFHLSQFPLIRLLFLIMSRRIAICQLHVRKCGATCPHIRAQRRKRIQQHVRPQWHRRIFNWCFRGSNHLRYLVTLTILCSERRIFSCMLVCMT